MRDLRPMMSESDLAAWHRRANDARERMRVIRDRDCPRCVGLDCELARGCTSRGSADDGDGGEMCQWAPDHVRLQANRDRVDTRAHRLRSAGCTDPDVLRLVAPATEPPYPPTGLRPIATSAALAMLEATETRTLVLSGGTGAGKSTAAAWIVAATPGRTAWISAARADSLDAWREIEERARDASLLVLDDLGRERETESRWAIDTLSQLLQDRHDSGRRTVVTTNLGWPALVTRYGDRWASRVRGNGKFVDVGSVDLRRRAA